ncbi:2-succinyl-5-enolpyruvyl-6-hydroxy-3-cyclohexene-1-carboxylic-acid synthase [Shewanella maritima]|uniref:2-succinyl-5-enolpyruvyl-6-hydroxy-3- cyclohexene-1-carboxylic-acid synthase n=1 Tax=Shewanella maritima TaxID=2520507 RepID=UPI003734F253
MAQQFIADINLLWGQLLIEEIHRLGVKHVCLAPGSRSSPLTLAASAQPNIDTHVHFDERGLGFMALGLAKSSQSPVAIITTSGTAVANLYPAIVEAWLTQVPLIVLSGDRPTELIDCGANQAIMQPGIFAQYAKQVNLPTPDFDFPAPALLTTIDEAISNLSQPVHINCMYREPLYPTQVLPLSSYEKFSPELQAYLTPLNAWLNHQHSYCHYHYQPNAALPCQATLRRFVHGKGVIIAGTLAPDENPQAIMQLAKQIGWPVLTDAQSQLRQHPDAIGHIDQLLHHNVCHKLIKQADRVIVFGGRFISKRLINYLASQQWHSYWQVLPQSSRLDPSHQPKQVWLSGISQFVENEWSRSSQSLWADELHVFNGKLEKLLQRQIDDNEFGEAQVLRQIAKQDQAKQLFIGNSLPVRLFDMFAPTVANPPHIFTNRGASGIDGLIATACGVAKGNQLPTTMIVGDISCLHDLNSFALLKQLTQPFLLVIFNNDGGNIFNLLPVPDESLRSEYYRLSHGLEFGYGAAMFGLAYRQVDDLADFIQVYQEAYEFNCTSIIEVTVGPNQASDQIAAMAQWVKDSL